MGCGPRRKASAASVAALSRRAPGPQGVAGAPGHTTTPGVRIEARQRLDVRFYVWLMRTFFSPWRWRRLKGWAAGLYPRVRRFAVAVTGPKLGGLAYAERNLVCRTCPYLEVEYLGADVLLKDAVAYCGSCGCGRWVMARLWGQPRWRWLPWPKNRLARAYCPHRKQPGPYPDDEFILWREHVQDEISGSSETVDQPVDVDGVVDFGGGVTDSVGPEESVVVEIN